MTDGGHPSVLEEFIADLNRAWEAAGPPSYAEVHRLSKRCRGAEGMSSLRVLPLPESTTNDILMGRRRGLPKWQWVASFVTVLAEAAREGGVDLACVGTLEEWKARHEAAGAALRQARAVAKKAVGAARGAGGGGGGGRTGSEEGGWGSRLVDVIALAREARVRCWWYAEHRDWLPEPVQVFLSLESAASLIRTYDTQTVPALLQTEAYARAVIAAEHPRLPRAEVERRVRLRTGRGRILTGPNTAKLWAVIDEAALRRPVGDAATMREQLESLRESCKRPNVTIQVLPERDGGNGGSDAPITLLRFPERQFPDVVHLAHVTGGLFLDDPDNVHHYSQLLSRLGIEADWPAQTEAFLDRILDDPQGGMP